MMEYGVGSVWRFSLWVVWDYHSTVLNPTGLNPARSQAPPAPRWRMCGRDRDRERIRPSACPLSCRLTPLQNLFLPRLDDSSGDREDETATHGEAQAALLRRQVGRGAASGHSALGASYLHIHARAPLTLPAVRHPPVSAVPPRSNPDLACRSDRTESRRSLEISIRFVRGASRSLLISPARG
jgi:hypothetical protein